MYLIDASYVKASELRRKWMWNVRHLDASRGRTVTFPVWSLVGSVGNQWLVVRALVRWVDY